MRTTTLHTSNRLLRGFADETRLRLISLLADGELCVCDLCDALKLPQPTVSRHLAYLRRSGITAVRRKGKWKHYSLTAPAGQLHHMLLNCIRSCRGNIDILARDLRRLEKICSCAGPGNERKASSCCEPNKPVAS